MKITILPWLLLFILPIGPVQAQPGGKEKLLSALDKAGVNPQQKLIFYAFRSGDCVACTSIYLQTEKFLQKSLPSLPRIFVFPKMKPSEVKWMLKNVANSDSVRFFSDDDIYAYLNPLPNSALVTAKALREKPPVATHFMKVGPPAKFFADWLDGQSWQLEASTLLEETEVPLGNITKIVKLSNHALYLFDQNYRSLTKYDLGTGKFDQAFSISDQQYHQYYQTSVEMDSAMRKKLVAIDEGLRMPKTKLVDIAPFGNQLIVSAILDFPMLDPKKAGSVISQRNTRLFLLDSNFNQIKDWRSANQGFIDKNIFPLGSGIAFDGQLYTCNFRFPISNAFEEIKENKAFVSFQLASDTLRPKETVGTIPGFLHDKSYYATNLETAIYQGVPYGGFKFAPYYWHGGDKQTYRLEIGLGEADFYHPADSSFHYRLLFFAVPNKDEVKILYRYKTALYVLHQGANYEVIMHEKLPFLLPNDKLPVAAFWQGKKIYLTTQNPEDKSYKLLRFGQKE